MIYAVVCVCVCEKRTWRPIVFSLTLSFAAFQRHNGDILTTASVKHLSHRRFVVSFQLDSVQRTDQDLYRCVTQSPRGSGVSNFAELVVKGKHNSSVPLIVPLWCFYSSCVCPQPAVFLMFLRYYLITIWTVLDTHEGFLNGEYYLPDACCFLSWGCQIACHIQLTVKKLFTWLGFLEPLSYHVPQMVTSLPLLTPTHSLTPLWQHSNDMIVGWFDGITNSSPQQKENEKGK